MPQDFDEIELPRDLSKDMIVVPPFGIEREIAGQSGYERDNLIRDTPLRRYTATYVTTTGDEKYGLITRFYYARRGVYPFRLYDWGDHTHDDAGGIGKVREVDGVLRLVKIYDDGVRPFVRLIQKPINPVVVSGLTGTPVVDYATGKISGATLPEGEDEGTWTGEFHVPARFDEEGLRWRFSPNGETQHAIEWGFTLMEKILEP